METGPQPGRKSADYGDGDGTVRDGTTTPPPSAGAANRLVNALRGSPDRGTVMALFDHLPPGEFPDGWAGVLLSCLQGGMAEGRSATVHQLAVACADYPVVAKGKWGAKHFRSCVERVMRGEKLDQRRGARDAGKTEQVLAETLAWEPPAA